tara:strand:- start:2220 stop:2429 length:210 start_codon:yes stop_codon:yes gene_type:complete
MNNKVNQLNERLADTLLLDLDDPDKCTPGLYQIIRGYINDNREALDDLPNEALDHLEKISDSIPFRRKA